jgi:hypothetical protein
MIVVDHFLYPIFVLAGDFSGNGSPLFAPGYSGMGMSFFILTPAIVFSAFRVNANKRAPEHHLYAQELRNNTALLLLYIEKLISVLCN